MEKDKKHRILAKIAKAKKVILLALIATALECCILAFVMPINKILGLGCCLLVVSFFTLLMID